MPTEPRFLQIHTLTSYPASLLNRDDAGFAKRIPFGDATRTRISSQCLKRHWRTFDGDVSLNNIESAPPESVRSRISFEEFVVKPLVKEGVSLDIARAVAEKLMSVLLGSEAKKARGKSTAKSKKKGTKAKARSEDENTDAGIDAVKTAQVTVLGRPELEYLCELTREACEGAKTPEQGQDAIVERLKDKELKKNIAALHPGSLEAGLGAALFGRMVTGDILSRTDAALHVAHSFTVHSQQSESDYFSAIDDLARESGEQGSGHINASELTSGLFYGYVVVDYRKLTENLGGNMKLAADVLDRLLHIIATVSPGAKLGSTAPYACSHLVLVESGRTQPRTLANAFLEAVPTRGNLAQNAYRALADHIEELDAMYGNGLARAHAGLKTDEYFAEKKTLKDLASWTRDQVAGGTA